LISKEGGIMASRERRNLTSIQRARFETLARKAEVLMEGWRRERGARLAAQLAINTEIKQRWLGAESSKAGLEQTLNQPTCARHFFSRTCAILNSNLSVTSQ
jgi:hypothetical protein